ncbi:MAG: hypothetical protein ACOCT0_00170 [Halobacteriota archaeon]
MSLDVGTALKYGVKRPLERDGLMLVAALWIVSIVNTAMSQTTAGGLVEDMFGDQLPADAPFGGGMTEAAMPLALPIPGSVAWLLGILASIVTIAVMIVAYRAFVEAGGDSLPAGSTSNLLMPTVHGFIGGIVFGILVGIGLVLLIIPGIFLAVSLAFYLAIIALKDVSFIEALQQSWGITKGERFNIFLLGVGFVVIYIVVGIIGGIASGILGFGSPALGEIAGLLFSGYASALVIGAVSHAYLQIDEDAGSPPSAD